MTDSFVSKDPETIAGMFDAIAARYDFLNHLLSAGIDRRWRRQAIRSLSLRGGERVLDLCTGTADLAIAARTGAPVPARIVGVDFASEMLRIGRQKLARQNLDDVIVLIRGDATRIPVRSESVDAVTIAFGIRNVDQPEAACREMHRVLRPGGRVAILEFAVPTMRGVRAAYLGYFRHVLPRIGRLISGHGVAYGYLPASVAAFASSAEFVEVLRRTGFVGIRAVPLTLGVVLLYTARRSES